MSLKMLVDINLSPDWIPVLQSHGWTAVHWSAVGDPKADDADVMAYAVANGFVIFTHDLDFGPALALTRATGPSVIQVRSENIVPDHLEGIVLGALKNHEAELTSGALVVVDEARSRVRILPI
jgi:predicted nuclease of predicted toxin-antitoxin system